MVSMELLWSSTEQRLTWRLRLYIVSYASASAMEISYETFSMAFDELAALWFALYDSRFSG